MAEQGPGWHCQGAHSMGRAGMGLSVGREQFSCAEQGEMGLELWRGTKCAWKEGNKMGEQQIRAVREGEREERRGG